MRDPRPIAAVSLLLLGLTVSRPALASPPPSDESSRDPNVVEFVLLHMNDVYEIAPIHQEAVGGLARVATLRKRLIERYPNTITLMAGDFFSPSAAAIARVNGERINGRQMVDVLNTLGLDYATFGNHEFDLDEASFLRRLKESRFPWVASNVLDAKGKPFRTGPSLAEIPKSLVFDVPNAQGAKVRVGLLGLTIDSNEKPYVRYRPFLDAAKEQVAHLVENEHAEIIVALTHLDLEDDQKLAEAVPRIDLILGGHEHENNASLSRPIPAAESGAGEGASSPRNRPIPPIFKADSNAQTVYIHRLSYDTQTHRLQANSRLFPITREIPDDPAVGGLVRHWMDLAFQGFRDEGFEPTNLVARTPVELDGRDLVIRRASSNLTERVGQAMLFAIEKATGQRPDLAVFNVGSIRIDDVIPPGDITQYDILRILPFGGQIQTVVMKGDLLARLWKSGRSPALYGDGGFLQFANLVEPEAGEPLRLSNGKTVEDGAEYLVAINDYLRSGRQTNLDVSADLAKLPPTGPKTPVSWQRAVMEYVSSVWPASTTLVTQPNGKTEAPGKVVAVPEPSMPPAARGGPQIEVNPTIQVNPTLPCPCPPTPGSNNPPGSSHPPGTTRPPEPPSPTPTTVLPTLISLVQALAWPITALLLAWIFREPLSSALLRIKGLEWGQFKASFEEQLKELKAMAGTPPPPAPELARGLEPSFDYFRDLERLARDAPRAAILGAWRHVEGVVRDLWRRQEGPANASLDVMVRALAQDRPSRMDLVPVFEGLQRMYALVSADPLLAASIVTPDSARDYLEVARRFLDALV